MREPSQFNNLDARLREHDELFSASLNIKAPYPYFAKFDVALKFKDTDMMLTVLNELERLAESKTFSKNTIIKNRAFYLAATGKLNDAEKLIRTGLDNYPDETILKFIAKLNNVANNLYTA